MAEHLIRLTKEQQKNPGKVIEAFLSDIQICEVRKSLSDCLEVALTTENDYYQSASERSWIVYFYKRLEELVEAAYLLGQQKKKV